MVNLEFCFAYNLLPLASGPLSRTESAKGVGQGAPSEAPHVHLQLLRGCVFPPRGCKFTRHGVQFTHTGWEFATHRGVEERARHAVVKAERGVGHVVRIGIEKLDRKTLRDSRQVSCAGL
eukprot:7265097-Pyramimonas_sp.AAC.1